MGWNDFDEEDGEQIPKPQPYDEQDWDGKESILDKPYDGSAEQKALIQKSLAEKYADASKDDDVKSAERRARLGNVIGDAFQGLGDYAMAGSVARGGPGMRDIRGGVQAANAQRVASAQGEHKNRIESVLEQDRLEQIEKDRARQTADQGFQDKERAQKEKGWKVDDTFNDPASTQSKAIRDQYAQMFPDVAKAPGFDGLSANDIKTGLSDPLKLKESIEARKEEAAQRSADRQAMMGARRDDKADEAVKKEGDYQASVKVPGLEVAPGFRPSADAAKNVREAKTAHDDLAGSLDALDSIYTKSGTNLVGDDSNTQESLVNSMRSRLKDLQRLGALSASDYALLDKQLPDPTSVTENIKGAFKSDSYKARSTAFRSQLERSLQNTAKNSGYRPAGSGDPANDAVNSSLAKSNIGANSKPAPHGNTVKQDGKTYRWNGSEYVEGQ